MQDMPGRTLELAAGRPDFSVFVWLRKTDRYAALKSEVLGAADAEPYEMTEYQGIAYFHWSAANLGEAKGLVDALEHTARHPELILLQIMSRVFGDEFISIKDLRRSMR
jgi:hypothetical protein